jgi:phi13 family phage major tail protein
MAFIGVRDLHFALLTSDDATAGAVYEDPEKIAGLITINVNPNTSSGTLFADDGPADTATALGEIEVEFSTKDLSLAQQAKLLGHEIGSDGVLLRKAEDIPPFVAVGYRVLKSTGGYRYNWLTKGKFRVPNQEHETKTNDVNFQTPTIAGSFLRREYDDLWQKVGDTDDVTFTSAATWFSKEGIDNPVVVTP